ncbi:MarR family transcriptional regulator [Pseudoroseomonas wenyumeiae]|uniref:MarR family transcriptional regulator n=1 Tax=Teichococcus wenyumeiae TaxID=2478470 RepID=A0A3A9JD18_9PROT|nr:helix-turn-helix domain-containing protein [Pseudoroseomonas wenyumeiae]RKK04412.1 MarR family transcriptional regulator [Pseudoroseomonas wenyumeiae]RMI19332.1 MarR family transcriptional regulator [Pseudoroseomonas wenyumeiae]
MPSYEPVTALLRGLDVLRAVNRLEGATVKDIHRLTGLNQPAVVRMLETLIHAGLVVRQRGEAVYVPTGRTLELSAGYVAHREVGIAATPVMEALRQSTGWPSDVAVFDGDAMVVAHTSRAEGRLLFGRRPGYRAPILATSLGRAFLAFCGPAERERALALAAQSPEPWNEPARDSRQAETFLHELRQAGFAMMDDAYSAREYGGLASAIGVPVLLHGSAIAALNLMFLKEAAKREEIVPRLLPMLQAAAREVSDALARSRGGGPAL